MEKRERRRKEVNNDRLTIKSSILNDRQKAVIETIRMRLNEKQSLEYLKEVGFDIGPATYYREKRQVEQMKLKRLYHIVKIGFQDQHLERIDIYEMGFKMMWQNVLLEKDPYKRNSMIKDILLLQPYLSAYYEATKLVIGDKQQQSEYKEFLDKQEHQIKQEKITESTQQQQIEKEDVIIDDGKEYDINNNAKF
jgi:hypothetical protein